MATADTFKKTSINILIAIVFLLCLTTVAKGAKILAFGDSITEGKGNKAGGYPPRLASLLSKNGKPAVVGNFGLSGERTPGGSSRFDYVLASFPADIVLIMEGTNDVHRGIPVETTKANLQIIIDKAKAAGMTPILSTLTPSNRGGSPTLIPQVWNPMIKELARSNGIKLVDQYAAILPFWSKVNTDGIHPNDSGYQIIADTWYKAIKKMISSTGKFRWDGGPGGFIAVAAVGSPVEKHIAILKEFRDRWLANSVGQQLLKAYYRISPDVVVFISDHEYLKPVVRVCLYPLIALCYGAVKLSLPLQAGLVAFMAVGLPFTLFSTKNRSCRQK